MVIGEQHNKECRPSKQQPPNNREVIGGKHIHHREGHIAPTRNAGLQVAEQVGEVVAIGRIRYGVEVATLEQYDGKDHA